MGTNARHATPFKPTKRSSIVLTFKAHQIIIYFFQRPRTVGYAVFNFGAQFTQRFVIPLGDKHRVVTEPLGTLWRSGPSPFLSYKIPKSNAAGKRIRVRQINL